MVGINTGTGIGTGTGIMTGVGVEYMASGVGTYTGTGTGIKYLSGSALPSVMRTSHGTDTIRIYEII